MSKNEERIADEFAERAYSAVGMSLIVNDLGVVSASSVQDLVAEMVRVAVLEVLMRPI